MSIRQFPPQHTWKLVPAASEPDRIPPLQPGDRLSMAEFERRYTAMPATCHAELIEGIVYMPSPVRYTHGKPHGFILGWLAAYCASTPGVELADNATVRLDAENEFQPDALLRIVNAAGGQSRISSDDYVEGAPELIVEIAVSSVSYDLYDKLPVYRRAGVREYLVWQVLDRQFDWFVLREGRYVTLRADDQGVAESINFPGLRLHVDALLRDDLATVLAELQDGLDTNNHLAFVEQLGTAT